MGYISIIKNAVLFAFSNPLCDGLEKIVSSIEENVAIHEELVEEEKKLLKAEEELFRRVTELQNTLLSKARTLEETNTRAAQVLEGDSAQATRIDKIHEIASGIVEQVEVNHQDLVDDMAKLKERATKLDKAKIQMGRMCSSSDTIKTRR